MPKAFIPAITGAQSTAIAAALRGAGWHVDGSSRKTDSDPESRAAGADALIMTVPQDHRPGAMIDFVDRWVRAAQRQSIGRIVLNAGGTHGPAADHPFFADLHAVQDRVASSGLPYVILRPTAYLDNFAAPWALEALSAGTIAYPAVAEAKVSWLSHQSLGEWVAAVAGGGADGRILQIGGPQALTGQELADEIGAVLRRKMTYVAIPPAAFAEGMNAAMGSPAGDRLASIYTRLADYPNSMQVETTEAERLGVRLETARAFASRVLS